MSLGKNYSRYIQMNKNKLRSDISNLIREFENLTIESVANPFNSYNNSKFESVQKTQSDFYTSTNVNNFKRKNSDGSFGNFLLRTTPQFPKILKVIARASLGTSVNIDIVSSCLPHSEINRKMKTVQTSVRTKPRSTCLIYENGDIVCTNSSSIQVAKSAIYRVVRLLINTKKFDLSNYGYFVVEQVIYLGNFGFPINHENILNEKIGYITLDGNSVCFKIGPTFVVLFQCGRFSICSKSKISNIDLTKLSGLLNKFAKKFDITL